MSPTGRGVVLDALEFASHGAQPERCEKSLKS
jgi:hypothetical protein